MPSVRNGNVIAPHVIKIFTAFIPVLFLCGCVLPVAAPLPNGVRLQRDVTYTPPSWPSPLTADIFHRPGSPPAPAVLLVHGGSWKAGGARWPMNGIARKLAGRGGRPSAG
jgi:acetyl esterase/lipase